MATTSLSADIPRLDLSLSTSQDAYAFSDANPDRFFSNWVFSDQRDAGDASLSYSILATENVDSLLFSFAIVNQSASTQTYTLDASLPVGPWTGPTYVGASIAAFVTDANLDGSAMLSTVGDDPLLRGFVDGQESLSLVDTPASATAPFLGGTAMISPQSVGLPGLDSIHATDDVLDEISIRLSFTLTPGDSASIGGVYVARNIPTPATVAMILLIGIPKRRLRPRI